MLSSAERYLEAFSRLSNPTEPPPFARAEYSVTLHSHGLLDEGAEAAEDVPTACKTRVLLVSAGAAHLFCLPNEDTREGGAVLDDWLFDSVISFPASAVCAVDVLPPPAAQCAVLTVEAVPLETSVGGAAEVAAEVELCIGFCSEATCSEALQHLQQAAARQHALASHPLWPLAAGPLPRSGAMAGAVVRTACIRGTAMQAVRVDLSEPQALLALRRRPLSSIAAAHAQEDAERWFAGEARVTQMHTGQSLGAFERRFIAGRTIGRGGSCIVKQACELVPAGRTVGRAVKIIPKTRVDRQRTVCEVQLQLQLQECGSAVSDTQWPFVRLVAVFESCGHLLLVQELAEAGELYARLGRSRVLGEQRCSRLCSQLLHALAILHEPRLCSGRWVRISHRDVKPENVLLAARRTTSALAMTHSDLDIDAVDVRLADFGLATVELLSDEEAEEAAVRSAVHGKPQTLALAEAEASVLRTRCHSECGTLEFLAPEILNETTRERKGYSGAASDMWSVGVTLFVMLCGRLPFSVGQAHGRPRASNFGEVFAFDVPEAVPPSLPERGTESAMGPGAPSSTGSKKLRKSGWRPWRRNRSASTTQKSGDDGAAPPVSQSLSTCATDILRRLLETNPARRITARQALRHPFFFRAGRPSASHRFRYTTAMIDGMLDDDDDIRVRVAILRKQVILAEEHVENEMVQADCDDSTVQAAASDSTAGCGAGEVGVATGEVGVAPEAAAGAGTAVAAAPEAAPGTGDGTVQAAASDSTAGCGAGEVGVAPEAAAGVGTVAAMAPGGVVVETATAVRTHTAVDKKSEPSELLPASPTAANLLLTPGTVRSRVAAINRRPSAPMLPSAALWNDGVTTTPAPASQGYAKLVASTLPGVLAATAGAALQAASVATLPEVVAAPGLTAEKVTVVTPAATPERLLRSPPPPPAALEHYTPECLQHGTGGHRQAPATAPCSFRETHKQQQQEKLEVEEVGEVEEGGGGGGLREQQEPVHVPEGRRSRKGDQVSSRARSQSLSQKLETGAGDAPRTPSPAGGRTKQAATSGRKRSRARARAGSSGRKETPEQWAARITGIGSPRTGSAAPKETPQQFAARLIQQQKERSAARRTSSASVHGAGKPRKGEL